MSQFSTEAIKRELIKCYAGFSIPIDAVTDLGIPPSPSSFSLSPHSIATGNFGCGVFGGDIPLKAIIQWMAASMSGRGIQYYAFADARAAHIPTFIQQLLDNTNPPPTISQVYTALLKVCGRAHADRGPKNLFKDVLQQMQMASST